MSREQVAGVPFWEPVRAEEGRLLHFERTPGALQQGVLIRFGPEFEGYTAAALIDDAVFGLKHMRDFERIAVVTDIGWIRDGVGLLAHLSPIPLKLFPADATEAALAWLDDADA